MKIVLFDVENSSITHYERQLMSAGFFCEVVAGRKRTVDFIMNFTHQKLTGLLMLGKGLMDEWMISWLNQIRAIDNTIPVLMIAESDNLDSILLGKLSGVSDYICEPFRTNELITRISVLIRQTYPVEFEQETLRVGSYVFYRYPNRLVHDGHELALTIKEFELARFFFMHIGQPLSRMTIGEMIWNSVDEEIGRTMDTHVSRIRTKLELNEENGFSLQQVYGYGYQLIPVS